MISLPVVVRELSVGSRRKSTYWARSLAALAALIGMSWLLIFGGSLVSASEQGRDLFLMLSLLCFVFALLAGMPLTADSISVEKRDGTLGLLFLTDLRGYDIVFGKLVSSSVSSLYSMLGIAPVLALAMLLGGVSWQEVVRVTLTLGASLALSLAAGILVSTISRNERKAMFAMLILILGLCALPFEVCELLQPWLGTRFDHLFRLSPVFAMWLSIRQGSAGLPPWLDYFTGIGWTLAFSFFFLASASALVPRVCQDHPRSRRAIHWKNRINFWSYGSAQLRQQYRSRLLDRNPFLWLAGRDRLKPHFSWFFVGMLGVIWFYVYWNFPDIAFAWQTIGTLFFIVFAFFKIWVASETCSRFMEDRRSGALELLLTTPLEVPEILRGSQLALRRQFQWQVSFLMTAAVALVLLGYYFEPEFAHRRDALLALLAGISLVIPDIIAIYWVGLSSSLTGKSASTAMISSGMRVMAVPWIVFGAILIMLQGWNVLLGRVNPISSEAWVEIWAALGIGNDIFLIHSARRRVLGNFRAIAAGESQPPKEPLIQRVIQTARRLATDPVAVLSRLSSRAFFREHWVACTSLLIFAIALAGFPAYRYALQRRVRTQLRHLERANLPVNYDQLEAALPPVEPANNGAAAMVMANSQFVAAPAIAFDSRFSPLRDWAKVTGLKDAAKLAISNNQVALETLRKATEFPTWRIDIATQTGPLFLFYSIRHMPAMAKLLVARAFLAAESDNAPELFRSLQTLLLLDLHFGEISANDYFGFRLQINRPLWEALQAALSTNSLTEPELKKLQSICEAADHSSLPAQFSLASVRAIRVFQAPISELITMWGGMGGVPGSQLKWFVALERMQRLSGAWDRQFIDCLERIEKCHAILEKPFPDCLDATTAIRRTPMPNHSASLAENILGDLPSRVSVEAERLANCRLAETALAIERFRRGHGENLPEHLSDLVPQYLKRVPLDPFDGKPIRYQPSPSGRRFGYSVYSIGADRVDNGGMMPATARKNYVINFSSVDIVWAIHHRY